jgi:hypothetical protein
MTKSSNKKAASSSKKQTKARNLPDDMTPQRKREINHILKRVKKNPIITPAFITSALRSYKLTNAKIAKVDVYKETLNKQYAALTLKADTDEKTAKLQLQLQKKLDRIDRIRSSVSKGTWVCLKAPDEIFLSKIKVPKPLSGYMFFAKEQRNDIKENNPEAGFGEIGRLIGAEWRKLDDAAKATWKSRAKTLVV